MSPLPAYSLGEVAKRFGCQLWQVRRLFERGILPEPPRVGQYRVIPEGDLSRVEEALRSVGYLREEAIVV